MVKREKNTIKSVKDPQDFPISKSKTLLANLNAYIRMLKKKFPNITSKMYIKNIHRFIDKIKRRLKYTDPNSLIEARRKIKICKECEGWSSNNSMIKCMICDDFYHNSCLENCPTTEKRETWSCDTCIKDQKKKKKDKNDHLKDTSKNDQC